MRRVIKKLLLEYVVITKYRYKNRAINEWEYQEEQFEVMYRDFSEKSKQNILNLVDEVENEKWCDFTDWVGDRWYDFESWIGTLNIKNYINNVNAYHKKVIDKNNTTKETVISIFDEVKSVDYSYFGIFENLKDSLSGWDSFILSLSEIVTPENGCFDAEYMGSKLTPLLTDIEESQVECLRDQMVQNIGGELIFDEDLILEYLKKSPAEMTDEEQAMLLDVISQLKDAVAIYETLASVGTDNLGADILNYVSWMADSTEYNSFSAVSAHYNEIYVNILNCISEQSKDENTFAASLVNVGIDEAVVSILGVETYQNLKDIFCTNSFEAYAAKYISEHSTQYFAKLEANETESLQGTGKFKDTNEWLKDKLKDNNWRKEDADTSYIDENGNVINKRDAPAFYENQISLAELKKQVGASASLYEGNFDLVEFGDLNVTVGEAEAHAGISAGLYVIGSDGEKKFSPGVNAEIGGSVTALEVGWEDQLLGDENFGLNSEVTATAGEVSGKVDGTAQIFDENGDLDVQLGVGANVEAIAAEVEGSVGVNVLGGEVGVTGGVNVGIGAHADVGYRDGILKADIGASLGIGASVSVEVDVGGMIDTICDTAEAAWNGIQEGWDDFMSWW